MNLEYKALCDELLDHLERARSLAFKLRAIHTTANEQSVSITGSSMETPHLHPERVYELIFSELPENLDRQSLVHWLQQARKLREEHDPRANRMPIAEIPSSLITEIEDGSKVLAAKVLCLIDLI